ncbi:TetR/AcrR family transcriptional regulator [Fructobacillus sp. M1-13]|uniref:TetR/AcrR family transcriptional regulator n=1 Tax=Fructobacillus papyriferae TaxID=2713171 RepID=A0ABS5QSN5_9LACO|nr:TetR/AcrR family transcriptional regulator [Fructobacillus papyriferae]MBS9335324.1 TetR/AcrR family transcriptional regulator [Fructobacillus papyriferae]MCD2159007.1 TetR/AcrR family transcriptional regulator [Fructobacillus papyriferae]
MANKTYTLMHEHLLETASALFASMPFSKITVKHICEKAEVNRNTFYRHFDDKFDLLEYIIKEALTMMMEQIDIKDFQRAPFTTINEFTFKDALSVLNFQLQDKVFEEEFYNAVFREMANMSNKDILWLLGDMQVIRIWNSTLQKPYSFQQDYKLFDEIIQAHSFPNMT